MTADYSGIWKLLIDEKWTSLSLKKLPISVQMLLPNLAGEEKFVPLETLEKIYIVLECSIEDVMVFIPQKDNGAD